MKHDLLNTCRDRARGETEWCVICTLFIYESLGWMEVQVIKVVMVMVMDWLSAKYEE